jgi:predicted transcriptional regulator
MEIIIVGRKRIHPDYDPERVLKELIGITKELYEKSYSYRRIALELDLSVSKVIKLLITGGVYDSDICRDINILYNSGKTVAEIQKKLHVSKATVQAYLPYKKGVYNAKECSRNAERIREYRRRKKMTERTGEQSY